MTTIDEREATKSIGRALIPLDAGLQVAPISAGDEALIATGAIGNRIICGSDFSPKAASAARVAAALASRLDKEVMLVHVVDQAWLDFLPQHVQLHVSEEMQARLRSEAETLRGLGLRVAEKFAAGAADEALIELAGEPNAHLLVISALGRRAPTVWRLGGIAERVAQGSPAPVLVVRQAAPFEAWVSGRHALRIVAGVDLSLASDAALEWIARLRKAGRCEVVAVHIDRPREQRARLAESTIGLIQNGPEMQRFLDADVRAKLGVEPDDRSVCVRLQQGWERIDADLARVAEEERADLLVVGLHTRHGPSRMRHGSVSRGVLHRALTNVACVPAPACAPATAPRPKFERVLVPCDLSSVSERAIVFAYSLVASGGAVRLLHVLPPPSLDRRGMAGSAAGCEKEFALRGKAAETRLHSLIPPDADERGIITEVKLMEDRDAARVICESADDFGAHAICMASHGRSGFAKAIAGSVAHEVLARTTHPVLLIPVRNHS